MIYTSGTFKWELGRKTISMKETHQEGTGQYRGCMDE